MDIRNFERRYPTWLGGLRSELIITTEEICPAVHGGKGFASKTAGLPGRPQVPMATGQGHESAGFPNLNWTVEFCIGHE
jgi:hypothetical protein